MVAVVQHAAPPASVRSIVRTALRVISSSQSRQQHPLGGHAPSSSRASINRVDGIHSAQHYRGCTDLSRCLVATSIQLAQVQPMVSSLGPSGRVACAPWSNISSMRFVRAFRTRSLRRADLDQSSSACRSYLAGVRTVKTMRAFAWRGPAL